MLLFLLLFASIAPFSYSAEAAVPSGGLTPPPEELLKLRDPFKRPEAEIAKVIAKSELEKVSVTDFKMVAVLTGPSHLRAVLQSTDGKSHVVKKGMKIGLHDGVIMKITQEKVLVRERLANVLGQHENLDTEIVLQTDSKLPPSGNSAANNATAAGQR